jgi:hypothetical protein
MPRIARGLLRWINADLYFLFFKMILFLLLILLAGFVCFIFYAAIVTDSLLGDYDFSTSKLSVNKVAEIIRGRTGNLYDLGSARGDFLLRLTRKVPGIRYYGLDNIWFRIWISRLKAFLLNKKIIFLHKNIFEADFRKADTVYIYLENSLLPKLEKKLQAELKEEAMVITNANSFPSWQPKAVYITHLSQPQKEKLFVYIKK